MKKLKYCMNIKKLHVKKKKIHSFIKGRSNDHIGKRKMILHEYID